MEYLVQMPEELLRDNSDQEKEKAFEKLLYAVSIYLMESSEKEKSLNRLMRYLCNGDITGINNMFLNSQNGELRTVYSDFLTLNGTNRETMQKQFGHIYRKLQKTNKVR